MSQKSGRAGATAMTTPEAAVALQDKLHILLSRLADAIDLIKSWPEAKGEDASIHVESTSKLIGYIRNVTRSIQSVETVLQSNPNLRKKLQECAIPMDLLDVLDHGQGGGALNPDCFIRGLLKEALGQLAGLKRRKLALGLLGNAVQAGLNQKLRIQAGKRERRAEITLSADEASPPAKRQKVDSAN
eukprot:scaffold2576_cov175-Amphora_coffeaeformis.AAC.19